MPLGPLAEELIKTLAEVLGEIVIRWPGKQLCRLFRRNVELDSPWALWVGLLFWLTLGYSLWILVSQT